MACRMCEESLTVILRTLMHFDLAVKVCTCHNGAPKAGVGCPASGAPKCASCNVGFTISHDGTQCIRTCVGLEVCLANTGLYGCTYFNGFLYFSKEFWVVKLSLCGLD